MSLIETWLAAGKDAGCKTNIEILGEMNDALGTNIQNNKIYEWRNGKKPPVEVINYMLSASILYALKQLRPRFKLTSAEQCLLMDMLSIPEKGTKK